MATLISAGHFAASRAGIAHRPFTDGDDEAGFFRERYKVQRKNLSRAGDDSTAGVPQNRRSVRLSDSPAAGNRLQIRHITIALRKVELKGPPGLHRPVHLHFGKPIGAFAFLLCAIKGHVGVLQKADQDLARRWAPVESDADADHGLMAVEVERQGNVFNQPLRQLPRVSTDLLDMGLKDRKLITAEPRKRIAFRSTRSVRSATWHKVGRQRNDQECH